MFAVACACRAYGFILYVPSYPPPQGPRDSHMLLLAILTFNVKMVGIIVLRDRTPHVSDPTLKNKRVRVRASSRTPGTRARALARAAAERGRHAKHATRHTRRSVVEEAQAREGHGHTVVVGGGDDLVRVRVGVKLRGSGWGSG